MKKTVLLSAGFVAIVLTVLLLTIYHKDQASREVKSDLGFRLISNDLIQLEGAIMFQMDNGWFDPNNVIEKVEDVKESIHITMNVAGTLNELSSEDEAVLTRLADYFERFPDYSGFPNHRLDQRELQRFEQLRRKLREAGWGMKIGYSSDWDELIEKANKLMNSR